MDEPERKALHKQQTDDIYRSIGQLVDSCSKRRGNCFQANLISMSLPRPLKKAWMGVR
jgi:hypothetical protein